MLVWTAILTINASTMLVAWWRKSWSAVQVFTGVPENHYYVHNGTALDLNCHTL